MKKHNQPQFKVGDYVSIAEGITPANLRNLLESLGVTFSEHWCAVVESRQFSPQASQEIGLTDSDWFYSLMELYPDHGNQITLNEDLLTVIEPNAPDENPLKKITSAFISDKKAFSRQGDLFFLEPESWATPFSQWTLGMPIWAHTNRINYDRIITNIAS